MNEKLGLQVLIECCQELLTQHTEFWLLASLSERSYEEGTKAPDFAEYVNFIAREPLDQRLLTELQQGINGNLAEIIRRHPSIAPRQVQRNQGKGPDIIFNMHTCNQVRIEIKLIYDCTRLHYYDKVANDIPKLDRHSEPPADRFLIVFFTQLPDFDYPKGSWYHRKKCPARASYCVQKGIQKQFRFLRTKLLLPSTWPQDSPYIHPMSLPTQSLSEPCIQRIFDRIFVPDLTWNFSAEDHLRDAKVGVAVWQRPPVSAAYHHDIST